MNSNLRKCFLGIAVGYVIILGGLIYWHLFSDLAEHPANPRYYLTFEQKRGPIFDRNGQLLASSTPIDANKYCRKYETASLVHSIGYFHQRYGLTGLEKLYQAELAQGREVWTTIDLEIQTMVEKLFADYNGACIILEPATGGVLAFVSSPSIDPNLLDEKWSDYLLDQRSPFLNRVTQGLYPPGSLAKTIVYAEALEQDLVSPEQKWDDTGILMLEDRTLSNFRGRPLGTITTAEALAYSSNVVFAELATELEQDLLSAFNRFGLGSKLVFELSNGKGYVPEQTAGPYDLAQLGIGQGKLLVTPLQMAVVTATIANRGIMMRPYIITEVRGGLHLRQITRPTIISQVISESTALTIRDGMVLAVQKGTAKEALQVDLDLAAKTGTAEVKEAQSHSWFMGFAPSVYPQVAVVVLVEHGGTGGAVATPLGARITGETLKILAGKKGKR